MDKLRRCVRVRYICVAGVLNPPRGHQSQGCASEVVKCCSCGENHVSGHSTCPDGKKEETMSKIQKDQKFGRAKSQQILETGVNIHTIAKEVKPYFKYIDIKIDQEEKRKLCPFKV